MQTNEPIRLEMAQRRRAAAVLARAFHNDPMYVSVLPEEGKRAAVLTWLFDRVAYYALL